MRRLALVPAILLLVVLLPACGSEAPEDEAETADAGEAADAGETAEAGETDDGAETETTEAATTTVAADPTTSAASGGGDFCDELEVFLDAWVSDEIGPADLTAEYQRLGSIAPSELVEPFEILATGNDEALAGQALSDQQAYDSSGLAVQTYAQEECGIQLGG